MKIYLMIMPYTKSHDVNSASMYFREQLAKPFNQSPVHHITMDQVTKSVNKKKSRWMKEIFGKEVGRLVDWRLTAVSAQTGYIVP